MLENITIGQYYYQNTWLYKINPTVKLIMTILFITLIFIIPFSTNIYILLSLLLLLFIQILVVVSAKIPLLKVLKGLAPLIFLMVFTFIIQIFNYKPSHGEKELFIYQTNISYLSLLYIFVLLLYYFTLTRFINLKYILFFILIGGIFLSLYYIDIWLIKHYETKVYSKSLLKSYYLVFRVINTVFATSILTFSTSTTELTRAFENIFRPLRIFKFPNDIFAIMMGLSFRFIPTLLKETSKIIKAQTSRGIDFYNVSFFKKIKLVTIILIPLFIQSIKKANDIADCMEVRGFLIGSKRTQIDNYNISKKDITFLVFLSVIVLTLVILKILMWVYKYEI